MAMVFASPTPQREVGRNGASR